MYEALISHLRECAKHDTAENTFTEAADAIEQLSNAGSIYGKAWTLGYDAGRDENMPRWIPVTTDKLPKNDKPVLVSYSHGVTKAWWNGRVWQSATIKELKAVNAWMPMPKPYKPPKEVPTDV